MWVNCNVGELQCGWIWNVSDSRQKRTQQHKGDLQIAPTTCANILIPCPWCFFVYLHVYLHVFTYIFANVQKTPVLGLIAISPSKWGQLKTWANCNVGEFATRVNLQQGWICNKGELQYGRIAIRPYDTRKKPHANITDLCSLFTFHFSLFTFHFSLFTFHGPLPSYFYSHFSQQFFLICTSKMLYFCIEFKTGLRR